MSSVIQPGRRGPGRRGRPAGLLVEPMLRAATALFPTHGYSHTSMAAVAAAAGVGKATLYAWFPGKRELFGAVIIRMAARHGQSGRGLSKPSGRLPALLLGLGSDVVRLLLANDAVAAHRMVITESVRSRALGRLYYENGPARLLAQVAGVLAGAMQRRQLRRCDPRVAAEHFIALVRGNLQLRALMCLSPRASSVVTERTVRRGVAAFTRAYAPAGRPRNARARRAAAAVR